MYRKFFLIYGVTVLILLLPLGFNMVFLWRAGELLPLKRVVDLQQRDGSFCIYGQASSDGTVAYRLASYESVRPEIIAVGSSRVMQLRQSFFTRPFLNLGGTVRSTASLQPLLERLFKVHHPSVMILALDPWWFGSDYSAFYAQAFPAGESSISIRSMLLPLQWMLAGSLSFDRYVATLVHGWEGVSPCRIGVAARERGDGFGPDGARLYTSTVSRQKSVQSGWSFQNMVASAERGEGIFGSHQTLSEDAVKNLLHAIRYAEAQGVHVAVIVPPIAPPVYGALQKVPDALRYVDLLLTRLKEERIQVVDGYDPAAIGTSSCEFFDGQHGGDIVSARLLKQLAATSTDDVIVRSLDRTGITDVIRTLSGSAIIPDARVTTMPETDFLGIGCKKNGAAHED